MEKVDGGEMPVDKEFERYREVLYNTIFTARANYEITWIFNNSKDRPKYIDVLNEYQGFFKTCMYATMSTMIVSCYKLLERGKDKITLSNLIKRAEYLSIDKKIEKTEFDAHTNDATIIWDKVKILRNNLYAHASKEYNFEKAFKEAGNYI